MLPRKQCFWARNKKKQLLDSEKEGLQDASHRRAPGRGRTGGAPLQAMVTSNRTVMDSLGRSHEFPCRAVFL